MLALNISDLGVLGVVGLIVIAFIFFGLVKGLVRMTFALVALGAGIVAGLWGFTRGGSIAGLLFSSPDPWMSGAVGAILGLAVFFVARALFGVLLSPVAVKDGKKKNAALPGGVIGLLMGAAFAWFVLSGVRYVGTLAELNWIKDSVADQTKIQQLAQPLLVKLKRAVDGSVLGQFHEKYDFLNDKAEANLAKLSVMVDSKLAVATAAQDKQVRDAVYQNEQIQKMLREQSSDLKSYIEDGQFAHLLMAEPIRTTAGDEKAGKALAGLDVEKALGLIKEEPTKKDDKKEKEKKK